MHLNPLAGVFVPQSATNIVEYPLASMAPTFTFQFNAEAEEFIPVSTHMEESVSESKSWVCKFIY